MNMTELIIFDLDDTLYNEKEYVISGFKAVSSHLDEKISIDYYTAYSLLLESYIIEGRGKNFNYLCQKLSIDTCMIEEMVEVYRTHYPNIHLKKDIIEFLSDLSTKYKLCLLTDGWVEVQKRKVEALSLENYFDMVFFSQQDGLEFAKPNKRYFKKVLEYFDVIPEEAFMVGDNLLKDIKGAKKMRIPFFHVRNVLDENEIKQIHEILS